MWFWVTDSTNNTADQVEDSTHASEAGAGHASAKADPSEAIWRGLADLDEKLFSQRNIRLLTPEARVLIHLKLNGSVPVTTAMQVAGTSYRGFYAVLERLKQAGIVATVKDPQDQRVRRLSLDPTIHITPVNR
jgi:hypothetical protein